MNVLITGGNGLLGTKLKDHFPNADCPTHKALDIRDRVPRIFGGHDLIIHCAAVKTTVCDNDPLLAMNTNIVGTANIVSYCHETQAKMVYISTDYVFKGDRGNYAPNDEVCPQNYYAETKLAGEYVVKCLSDYLIVRLSFFPDEYPYEGGFIDQWTTRLPVSKAAAEIATLINLDASGIHHIVGPKQTVYEYALETTNGKKIKPMKMSDHAYNRPLDTSLIDEN